MHQNPAVLPVMAGLELTSLTKVYILQQGYDAYVANNISTKNIVCCYLETEFVILIEQTPKKERKRKKRAVTNLTPF